MNEKVRAERNRTITLTKEEIPQLQEKIIKTENLKKMLELEELTDKTINGDILESLKYLPDNFADLIIIDPPYNLTKNFNGKVFSARSETSYDAYLETWFPLVCKKLKDNGSLYICGDWKCTSSLQKAVEKELTILNRITWQREKGRGATGEQV